jgi:hypothetical protein
VSTGDPVAALPLPDSQVRAFRGGDHIVKGHSGNLAQPQPGPEHERHQETVTARPRGLEDAPLLGLCEGLRLDTGLPRRSHFEGLSADTPPLPPAEAEEVPDDPMKRRSGPG